MPDGPRPPSDPSGPPRDRSADPPTARTVRAGEKGARALAMAAAAGFLALLAVVALRQAPRDEAPLAWASIAPPAATSMRAYRWLVIHHSATGAGETARIDRDHHQMRGWEGIGYHFVIGNGNPMVLGAIDATFRWRNQQQGAHAGAGPEQKPFNDDGVGICLIGDFRTAPPHPYQEQRLVQLCAELIHHVPSLSITRIIGHRDVPGKATACPGARVDIERIRFLVRAEMERRGMPIR